MGRESRANRSSEKRQDHLLNAERCTTIDVKGLSLKAQVFRRCVRDQGHRGRHDWGPWQAATYEQIDAMLATLRARP